MCKIVSFSLWGNNPKYLIGAIKNLNLVKKHYSDFKIYFYTDILVPTSILFELEKNGAKILQMGVMGDYSSLFWRYFPLLKEKDIELLLVRDCDSRISEREVKLVEEFKQNNQKTVHTIFDHPSHYCSVIMPGLSAFKKNIFPSTFSEKDFPKDNKYGVDYIFFTNLLQDKKDEILIHDSFQRVGQNISVPRKKLEFCGEVFNEKNETIQEHKDLLRIALDENKNENYIYIYTHQGLGDHLDCNGMVREYSKHYDRVYVLVKERYSSMVEYMYRDSDKIIVVPFNAGSCYELEIKNAKMKAKTAKNFLEVGHTRYPWGKEKILNKGCAEIFYDIVGISFKKRFDSWYFERDLKEEEKLFNKLNPNNEPYIFVHDDPSRGFEIKEEKIFEIYGEPIKIIYNDIKENLFHFCKILEDAKQIHCMESCFKSLIEVLDIKGKLYFHNFRPGASSFLGLTRQFWNEIKYEESKVCVL